MCAGTRTFDGTEAEFRATRTFDGTKSRVLPEPTRTVTELKSGSAESELVTKPNPELRGTRTISAEPIRVQVPSESSAELKI